MRISTIPISPSLDDFFRQAEIWMPPEKPKAQLTVRFDGELSLWRASLWRANGHDAIQSPAACQNERRRITVKVSEGHGRPREHPEPEDRVSAGLTVWLPIEGIPSEIGQAALLTSDVEVYAEVCPENVRVGRSCPQGPQLTCLPASPFHSPDQ